jgi:hypothetical protein
MYLYRIFLFSRGSIVGREDFRAPDHAAAIGMGRALLGLCPGCEYFDLWQEKRRIPVDRFCQDIPLHELPADLRGHVAEMAARICHGASRAA